MEETRRTELRNRMALHLGIEEFTIVGTPTAKPVSIVGGVGECSTGLKLLTEKIELARMSESPD